MMKNLLMVAGMALLFNACNENGKKHTDHNVVDPAHADHESMAGNSEMKQVMDAMMTKMHQQKATGNIDIDYANMMLQHHQGAVDMAKLQLSKGEDTSLKAFSNKVITDQQREIAFMGEFISKANNTASGNAAAFKTAMDASMQTMMSADAKIYNDIDRDFVAQMIPHHQSAVDMARAYLEYGNDEGLKKMSRDIISSQEKEIEWLKGKVEG